jgi:hypothetical protein
MKAGRLDNLATARTGTSIAYPRLATDLVGAIMINGTLAPSDQRVWHSDLR